ncbi:MAG: hypothetical protein ABI140_01715 [Jatrophihabitantaceae bacterium]
MKPASATDESLRRPDGDDDSGVEGNARLTAANGTLLIALLAVEGFTVLNVRGLITLHVFVGVLLIGPVLLKTASTMYRFTRYYLDKPEYVRRGPPHPVLRLIGPLVVLSSLAVLGTGVGLLAVQPGEGILLTLHKASFVVWFGLMSVHVLGHLREALVSTWHELTEQSSRQRLRLAGIVLALLVGVGAATILLPSAHQWTHRSPDIGQHRHDR